MMSWPVRVSLPLARAEQRLESLDSQARLRLSILYSCCHCHVTAHTRVCQFQDSTRGAENDSSEPKVLLLEKAYG